MKNIITKNIVNISLLTELFTEWNTLIINKQLNPILCIPGYTPKYLTTIFINHMQYSVLKSVINEKLNILYLKDIELTELDKEHIKEYERYLDIIEYRSNTLTNYRLYLTLHKNIYV